MRNCLNQTLFNKYSHLTGTANLSGSRIPPREDPQCCWNLDPCKKMNKKNSRGSYKTYFSVTVSRNGRKNRTQSGVSGV